MTANNPAVRPKNNKFINSDENNMVKLIAFYLPQFHPIQENDEWWGKGFTEWTNVTKAIPLFPGHYQPHLPTEMGFYDLRVRETRHAQIKLAKEHGIDAFCYHYYWFSGKRLLEAPLEDTLNDRESDMPFCLCWANENWTRTWDGGEQHILIEQRYNTENAYRFIEDIAPYLTDPRYLRINNAPLLIVYRPQDIPNIRETTEIWRGHARTLGIDELHLCAALTHGNFSYANFGFDSGVEFPPHNRTLLGINCINKQVPFDQPFQGGCMLFHEFAQAYLDREREGQKVFRCVFPSWDNTARRGNRALFFLNGTPGNYEYWLAETIRRTHRERPESERLVFINAWNEWAEGCHLEPDHKYGQGFLEATLRAKQGRSELTTFPDTFTPTRDPSQVPGFFSDLKTLLHRHAALLLAEVYDRLKERLIRHPKTKRALRKLFFWY